MERALELDSTAKAKGITALMGIGVMPGLSNLMMLHAAHQLDKAESVRACFLVGIASVGEEAVKADARRAKETGRVSASWQMFMKLVAPPFHAYHNGTLTTIEHKTSQMMMLAPGNGEIPAVLISTPETITLPRSIPGTRDVDALLSWFPFQLNSSYMELGGRITKGELSYSKAGAAFLDSIVAEYRRKQAVPSGFAGDMMIWTEAKGIKNGRPTTYTCWPASMNWVLTAPTLAVAALKILKGEITTHGVLAPESCLDPLPFFKDVARQVSKEDVTGNILKESWQPP